jgi:serine/threonine protein kinase
LYLLGRLDPPQSAAVEDHLSSCSHCATILEAVPASDSLVAAVRQQAATTGPAQPALLEGLIERIRQLRPGAQRETVNSLATVSHHERPTSVPAVPGHQDNALPLIGKYQAVERLGRGGQAEVYRAWHSGLGREVVIKWARASLPEALHRALLDEGRVLARLEDPGLVRVHDVDLCQGRPFIVMEYVGGRSLSDVLRQGLPTPRAAATLVAQLARTLDHVHRHGVLHRDLKPANVLIDPTGRPRLLDFGLAWVAQPWSAGAHPGHDVCGTLHYMAPEQANGQGERIGVRTDVFGLGGILYTLLTGRPLYEGTNESLVWQQACQAQITRPRQLNRRVPRSLERICLKALAPDPAQRYESAAALHVGLRRHLRRRWLAGAALLGLAAVLLLAFWPRPRPELTISSNPPVAPPAVDPPRITLFEAIHYQRLPVGQQQRGTLGKESFAVRFNDLVRLRVGLSRPAYLYLLAFNANGKDQLLWPDRDARPPLQPTLEYPPGAGTALALNDEPDGGIQAFAVVASAEQLPTYAQWKERPPTAWERIAVEGRPEVVWWGNGQWLDEATPGRSRSRADLERLAGLAVLEGLGQSLRKAPAVADFFVVAFPVWPRGVK